MYVSETRTLREAEQNLPHRTEVIMLRWILGTKGIDKIRTEEITARAGLKKPKVKTS